MLVLSSEPKMGNNQMKNKKEEQATEETSRLGDREGKQTSGYRRTDEELKAKRNATMATRPASK